MKQQTQVEFWVLNVTIAFPPPPLAYMYKYRKVLTSELICEQKHRFACNTLKGSCCVPANISTHAYIILNNCDEPYWSVSQVNGDFAADWRIWSKGVFIVFFFTLPPSCGSSSLLPSYYYWSSSAWCRPFSVDSACVSSLPCVSSYRRVHFPRSVLFCPPHQQVVHSFLPREFCLLLYIHEYLLRLPTPPKEPE